MAKRDSTATSPVAPIINTYARLDLLLSIARIMLRAVEQRHDHHGDLQIGIEHIQVSAQLLVGLLDETSEAKDKASGKWCSDLMTDADGMGWYEARAMLALIENGAWQIMEEGHDVDKDCLATVLSDIERALGHLCKLLDKTRKSLPSPPHLVAAGLDAA